MQKLQLGIIKKLIAKKATSAEIDLLLYISKFQNNHGVAEGVYYKDACEELGFSYQTFYDAKKGLIAKEIITAEKRSYTDHDITILDNEFLSPEDYKKGYLNTNYNVFSCSQFKGLTAGAKLLTMDLMKNNLAGGTSFHIGTRKFFAQYKETYGICERTLRDYLKMLKLIFSIGIKDREYYFTVRKFARTKQQEAEEQNYRDNAISVAMRRNKLKNVRQEDKKELESMLCRYASEIKQQFCEFSLSDVICRSIEKQNVGNENRRKWKRQLKPNLVHRLLRKALDLSVNSLVYDKEPEMAQKNMVKNKTQRNLGLFHVW